MAYPTQQELEQYLGVTIDVTLADFVEMLLTACREYVEGICGGGIVPRRSFAASDTEVTRYYDGNDLSVLPLDDVREISSIVVDGVELTQDEDYYLYPANAAADGEPYQFIEMAKYSPLMNSRIVSYLTPPTFTRGQRNIAVTGKFGFSTDVPAAIKISILRLAGAILQESPGSQNVRSIEREHIDDYDVTYTKISEVANRVKITDMLGMYIRTRGHATPTTGIIKAS